MLNNLSANFFENIATIFTSSTYLEMIIEGLKITLIVTVGAGVIGIILGAIVALTKIIAENNPNSKWLKIPNAVCDVYVTVIRGTPMALNFS